MIILMFNKWNKNKKLVIINNILQIKLLWFIENSYNYYQDNSLILLDWDYWPLNKIFVKIVLEILKWFCFSMIFSVFTYFCIESYLKTNKSF